MTKLRVALILVMALGGTATCGRPCQNLWKKLESCAETDRDRRIYKSSEMKKAYLNRCRKADKSRIKECLKLKSCDKLRKCAERIYKKTDK